MLSTTSSRAPMAAALALADRMLGGSPAAFASAGDPLRIQLPPVVPSAAVTPETVRAVAALYLQAELEETGVLYAADVLAESQYLTTIRDVRVIRLLEEHAKEARTSLTREQRQRLFARLFGTGIAEGAQSGGAVNHDFQRLFAVFAAAMVRAAAPASGFPPQPGSPWAVRQSGSQLLNNVGALAAGGTVPAARQIQARLRGAIAILSHEGTLAHAGVRTMWDVLRAVFGQQTPDFGRLLARGQCGLRILSWLAANLPYFLTDDAKLAAPRLDEPASSAAQWLAASGFQSGERT